jgi:hypothetical protein
VSLPGFRVNRAAALKRFDVDFSEADIVGLQKANSQNFDPEFRIAWQRHVRGLKQ